MKAKIKNTFNYHFRSNFVVKVKNTAFLYKMMSFGIGLAKFCLNHLDDMYIKIYVPISVTIFMLIYMHILYFKAQNDCEYKFLVLFTWSEENYKIETTK